MAVSVFDLFKIGIGPSSSHTVGPMRAAARFVTKWLVEAGELERTARVRAEVFGSLALTGRGHGTDKAVLMGLEGHQPNLIDPDLIPAALERIRGTKILRLGGTHAIAFDGACLRTKCESDPAFGYMLIKRFAAVMMDRMQATRLQLLDMYGNWR